jgi:hypothetical protein
MAMNTSHQHQRPFAWTAAVRSTPSPQHAARLRLESERPIPKLSVNAEEKSFDPRAER